MFAFAEGYPFSLTKIIARPTRSYGKRSDEIRGYVERRFETKYICMYGYPYNTFISYSSAMEVGCAVYVIGEGS